MMSDLSQIPTAVVIAHPGHEVRVHRWLELTRPVVFIITDGSGRSGESRLSSTSRLLADINVKPGHIFGHFTERRFYDAVLNQELSFFLRLAEELAQAFMDREIERVVGDAAEGYNSTHDVCRLLINAAVEIVNRAEASSICNYDFPVVGSPGACPEALRTEALWVHLDDDAFARKINAARKYYPELLEETRETFAEDGVGPWREYLREAGAEQSALAENCALDQFRLECMRPVKGPCDYHERFSHLPFYERHGESRREAGFYDRVIRYREHLVPIAQTLRRHAEGGC
jgi:hypothetical protein